MAGPRSSFPIPSEPSMRRLGVGGGGPGPGGERPLRAQLVVAICAAMVLLAVPLYLLRKPSGEADEAAASASAPLVPSITLTFDAGPAYEKVRLGAPQRHKCSASKGTRGQEGAMCDRLPFFEEALAKGIKDSVDCAPKTGKEGSINYALSIDFRRKKLTVFPGASGEWTGPQAKRAAKCVLRTMPPPDWTSMRHQYQYYLISVLATYPPPPPTATPEFE